MKKILMNLAVLLSVFIGSVFITSMFINQDETVVIHNMSDATLPILYMEVSDTIVNPMYGYAEEIEKQYVRDSITPLPTDRELTLVVKPLGAEIDSIQYEVSTADGLELVETATIGKIREEQGYLYGDFKVEHPILMNQEYTLRFEVSLGNGESYYYYTRLLQKAGVNISEYLAFANMFYTTCLDKEKADHIATYLEPKASQVNDSFAHVDIYSSLDCTTWGSMQPKLVEAAYPVIKDMNETTCSIVMEYMISSKMEGSETDYYMVTDFYRMRYYQSRVRLLNFQRDTEELFSGTDIDLTSTGLNIGITDKDVEYVSNGDIVAFVQAGELWSYNRNANKISKIYSFRSGGLDIRENLQHHGIKIVRVEENNDVDFVVYGYMNCDGHEGQVGIGVYHYDAELNQIHELIFIPVLTSYEFLQNDMGILSYVSRNNMLYLLLEEDLYCIDIENKSYSIKMEDLVQGTYVVSKSQASIAWMSKMEEDAARIITVMDLETENTYNIYAENGQKIKALGFMNEDFVYGIANDGNILVSETGQSIYLMHTIRIERFGGELMKEYMESAVWVKGVNLKAGLLELLRVKVGETGFVDINSDHIMNNLQSKAEVVDVRVSTSTEKLSQIVLDFDKSVSDSAQLYLEANVVNWDMDAVVDLGVTREEGEVYYVYAGGGLDSIWTSASGAILRANEQMGTVLNRRQQYVWERGNRDSSYLIRQNDIPKAILNPTTDEEQLARALGDDYTVLNMTGCTLDSVLYQVGQGNPVIAKVSDTVTVVIVGYNSLNTILYYPVTGEQGYYGMQDSTDLFEQAGNVFLGYMENLGEATKGAK